MIDRYKAFIFDLDNTLIDENSYLKTAYKEISRIISAKNEDVSEEIIYHYLIQTFETEGRTLLLDKLISRFSLQPGIKDALLSTLRTIRLPVKLQLMKDTAQLLNNIIEQDKIIAIATNGNKQQQQNKLDQIDWNTIPGNKIHVYFAADYEPKPSPAVLSAILQDFRLSETETVFIGDTIVDKQSADAAGVDFYYLTDLLNNIQK